MSSALLRTSRSIASSSRWPALSAAAVAPFSLAPEIGARPKSTLAPAQATEQKFIQWDGLTNGKTPALVNVRSFPIIGSAIPQLSGTPAIDPLTKGYDYWLGMHNQFGEFYSFGSMIGGNRNDIYRTTHVVKDPRECAKVVRAGGKYPSGVLEFLWVNERWAETRDIGITEGIHGRGEEWRRVRTFLQTDLLHPESARGYLPGIINAAGLASKGAQAAAQLQSSGKEKGALNSYLNRCAFDMFSSMMLGIYTETANVTTPTDPENERFVKGAVQGLGTAIAMLFSPYELIVGNLLKFETAKMKHCFEGFDAAWAVAQDKIEQFRERKDLGQLTENEQVSYLSRALERQKEDGSNVSVRDVTEIAFISLFAAVDTTSSVLGWNLFHIARSPHVQDKLYSEILHSVETVGEGKLTAEVLSKSNAPYLHAIIRETQRLTPASPIPLNKTVGVDNLEIHGRKMQKGDVVVLEAYSVGMNPDLVDTPEEFQPERWLKGAVEARKGTSKEIIDHPFLSTPFSQGARKCPGSRVATNEIHALLSQLVLDWKISSPVTNLEDVQYQMQAAYEVKLPDLIFEAR
eukprot:CAMPEP_0197443154 /NCGR_PEP_ID=MMETSP1175-20131217/8979_1 /TAXON_ID=1003142 /ORGANISM="Triceratium dubium, Strain CCMP147" /LENGTH=574 /DNA_ID=CAMNT_0042973751 /DNA_START=162 /DNA_END=1886 /DNA_ORIENTATION=+